MCVCVCVCHIWVCDSWVTNIPSIIVPLASPPFILNSDCIWENPGM